MNLNSLRYSLRQGVVSLRRNALLALVTTTMVAVSLSILGGFLLISANVQQIVRAVENTVEIAVFADADADLDALRRSLDALAGVSEVRFVSRAEGLEELGRTLNEPTLMQVFTERNNPLPDVFRVRVAAAGQVREIAEGIRQIAGVEAADYGEELIAHLLVMTRWVSSMLIVISALLGMGAIFLVVAIIRLSVIARQEEIGVMKYLGASNGFIRLPFLLEGTVIGLLGALLASSALWIMYGSLARGMARLALPLVFAPVTDLMHLGPVFGGIVALGIFVGAFGSLFAVRKYLRQR